MNRTAKIMVVLCGLGLLAGCGSSPPDRGSGRRRRGRGHWRGGAARSAGPPGALVGAAAGAAWARRAVPRRRPSRSISKPVWDNNMHVGDANYTPKQQ